MEIPVFCYHNAVAEGLEKDLRFLADNGYQTLTASALVDILSGHTEAPRKPVALTFDDGLLSVKTVGLPLLERYDAYATVFAITGMVPEGVTEPAGGIEPGGVTESGGDAKSGGLAEPGGDDSARLLGWDDLRSMQRGGRIEVGSHGHRHNPVHVGTTPGGALKVADYGRLYDVPVPFMERIDAAAVRALDGTPLRRARPLFVADTVIVDGARTAAAPLVAADLGRSAALLAQRAGVDRRHLCLPYGAGSEAIVEHARGAGFASIFWSRRGDRASNRPGDDPFRIVRRKHDLVRRLPGRGRRSQFAVLATKIKRRLTADPWE